MKKEEVIAAFDAEGVHVGDAAQTQFGLSISMTD